MQAQCPPENVVFSNQADVDAFVANYPNCTEIQGNLQFGFVLAPLGDFSLVGLYNIEVVHG